MKGIFYRLGPVLLAAILSLGSYAAEAAVKLKVITSGGFAATLTAMEPQLEKDTGLDIDISYGSSSGGAVDSIPERLKRGEQFDVLILSRSSLDKLTNKGFVTPDSRTDLVRSRIGMCVKKGAAKPDISTPESFIKVLHEAKSIGYSASASGTYLSNKLWPKMGLWQMIEPKSTRVLSKRVASLVADGQLEIGFQQISEILPIQGAELVGPIPDKFQKVTTFSLGVTKSSLHPQEAAALIHYLASDTPYVINSIRHAGLDPVVAE
ncbi:molybdate ABC transporter substrate-binding protein [Shewanella dokdonensis]|uniref:Substrate-binding domain-containing protein n=1 Tax=Shewanella dokdonensis TaxID=712036 RepID=A0ABX8DEC7_9GAMM|nr:substrate-binding domain-containing protein [Shewanella dokdonensis]MCL1073708.1 substrate-binding domain-containing protein [Shewanella dokdonensis]QVK22566.1 substrate-binding domain-containing protein [Shewanella dokdonensis]